MDFGTVSDTQQPELSIAEGLAFDEIVERSLQLCERLPEDGQYGRYRRQIAELSERLAGGRLHLAVLGQFNRGKSTFLNALLGLPVLPVSVLPITSVPTVIVHGTRSTCTVEFADGRPPKRSGDSIDDITRVLLQFVAEQNNPGNQLGVSRVTVTCDSPILRHGTVLIDTPGFGSTHIHNTRTTRALVEGCDAALFLLSADLPITQVEVDFLKDVKRFVPRIFFVYNKTDILSEEELAETSTYVRDVLIRTLHFTEELCLFPISAKAGQAAQRHDPDDSTWSESGMERIRSEVVDFLLREKYFALSEVLNDKCKAALDGILDLLREERAAVAAPLEKLKSNVDAALVYAQSVRRDIDTELGLIPKDESALCRELENFISARKDEVHRTVVQSVEALLSAAAAQAGSHELVRSSISGQCEEMFAGLYLQLVSAINGSLRKRAEAHYKRLLEFAARVASDMRADTVGLSAAPPPETLLDTSVAWRPTVMFEMPRMSWPQRALERLRTRHGRQQMYNRELLPVAHEHTDLCLQQLSSVLKSRIHAALARLSQDLSQRYSRTTAQLELWLAEKKRLMQEMSATALPRLETLDSLSDSFAAVRDSLL